MRQDIVEVDWLLFPEDARAVEKRLRATPGIQRADVNPVTGLGVVAYDETRLTIEGIQRVVAECGYHCRGSIAPRHLVRGSRGRGTDSPTSAST